MNPLQAIERLHDFVEKNTTVTGPIRDELRQLSSAVYQALKSGAEAIEKLAALDTKAPIPGPGSRA